MEKKHSGEEDSDGAGAAEAPVGAAVPSTLEPQQQEEPQQEVEDLERTLDAVDSDMEELQEVEVMVCLNDNLNNSAWVSNEVTLSSGGAEEEAPDMGELDPPETWDMEDQSEANTAVTTGSEDFDTVYRSCFSDNINNNLSMTTVNIGDKVVTITGDTMDLVMEARRRIEEAEPIEPVEAGAVEAALPEDVFSGEDVVAGEMESSALVTEMPAPDGVNVDRDPGAEVLETEAQDLPRPALNTAAAPDTRAEEGSIQEPSTSTGGQSVGHKCSVCLKSFKHKGYYLQHLKTHQYGRQFKCQQCPSTFEHSSHLKNHIKDQHSLEKIACKQCGKEFRSSTNLKEHEKVFHAKKNKLYPIELKQEAFKLVGKLGVAETARQLKITRSAVNHWVTATKKTFTCNFCGKELCDSTRLKYHINRNHGKMNE